MGPVPECGGPVTKEGERVRTLTSPYKSDTLPSYRPDPPATARFLAT